MERHAPHVLSLNGFISMAKIKETVSITVWARREWPFKHRIQSSKHITNERVAILKGLKCQSLNRADAANLRLAE